METPENKEKIFRLGIRMDPALNDRLEDAVLHLKRVARIRGERVTKDSIVQDAVERHLDFLEKNGDEMMLNLQEIIEKGSEKTRRTVKSCLLTALEEARATEERRTKGA